MVNLLPLILFARVVVTTEIEEPIVEGDPIKGTLTVTHEKDQEVDFENVQVKGETIQVEFLKEVRLSKEDDTVISIYNFKLPPKEKGLYLLPEIAVTVGGEKYLSIQSSYEVEERPKVEERKKSETLREPILRLEPYLEGNLPLYPGQRITVGYRMWYSASLELTKEELPLLDAEGFRKIGGKQIDEASENGLNLFQVTQEIEAISPGDYYFPPSRVEGRAYLTEGGERNYFLDELKAEINAFRIEVLPFKETRDFDGSVGTFTHFDAKLKGDAAFVVGEKIPLQLTFTSEDEESVVVLPKLCCLPGFSGLFETETMPAKEHVKGNRKQFTLILRPLSILPREIPEISFTFLDPKSGEYQTLKTEAIPINVQEVEKPKESEEMTPQETLPPIEIRGNYSLSVGDIKNRPITSPVWFLLIPLGLLLLFFQLQWKGKEKKVTPEKLFKEAIEERSFPKLKKALLAREKSSMIDEFLQKLDQQRFSKSQEEEEKLFQEAKKLWRLR